MHIGKKVSALSWRYLLQILHNVSLHDFALQDLFISLFINAIVLSYKNKLIMQHDSSLRFFKILTYYSYYSVITMNYSVTTVKEIRKVCSYKSEECKFGPIFKFGSSDKT